MLIAEHILWLGSILETLDLAIVTPHTAHPRGETEKRDTKNPRKTQAVHKSVKIMNVLALSRPNEHCEHLIPSFLSSV